MPNFSKASKDKLASCESDLQDLFNSVINQYDCTIIEGQRSTERQEELLKEGASRVKHSKHNYEPSKAVDVSPFPIPENWGRIPYTLLNKEDREHFKRAIQELCRFYHFAGYTKGVADNMNIPIRCGADWDGDNDFNDQTFNDLIHFEIK
jgi:peptidoglycan L-alanyl-D-glutamate endopeptidase CwlK